MFNHSTQKGQNFIFLREIAVIIYSGGENVDIILDIFTFKNLVLNNFFLLFHDEDPHYALFLTLVDP